MAESYCLTHTRSNNAGGSSAGKPVAVTSNRGAGKASHRPGANPQLEQQFYQWKQSHPKSGEELTSTGFTVESLNRLLEVQGPLPASIACDINFCLTADEDLYRTPSQDSPGTPTAGAGRETAALSMAEIASCSYEAR